MEDQNNKLQGNVSKRIQEAVVSLMATTSIEDISVKDIITLAGISRSTFYRYYSSVDEVIKTIEQELLDALSALNRLDLAVSKNSKYAGLSQSDFLRAEIIYERAPAIRALIGANGDPQYKSKIFKLIREGFHKRYSEKLLDYPYYDFFVEFIAGGFWHIINYWIESRPDIPPEQYYQMTSDLYGELAKFYGHER